MGERERVKRSTREREREDKNKRDHLEHIAPHDMSVGRSGRRASYECVHH